MTRPLQQIILVSELIEAGHSQSEIARRTGIPRKTITDWVRQGFESKITKAQAMRDGSESFCIHVREVEGAPYAYLLGLYLGDGCISSYPKGVFALRISVDKKHPGIAQSCAETMEQVLPNPTSTTSLPGCVEVHSWSKHWPCLFPQHGPGKKHLRRIELEPWQEWIAVERHPKYLLKGLIQSDGSRYINRIRGRYEYPSYSFSNRSADIRAIFMRTCDRLGVRYRQPYVWTISIARREDVQFLDTFIGPKY